MIRWIKRALVALVAAVAIGYPLAGWSSEQLDDAARANLLSSGQARQFVTLPMGTMHVRISGPVNGPPVLLIHGGMVGGYGFQNWQKPLADAGFRIIVPDLFGYGFSDRPDTPYTRQFYVDQLAQLLDTLGTRTPVHVVGASMGGAIATAFTASFPARVRSVALMAPAGGGRVAVVNGALLWPVIGDVAFRMFGSSYSRDVIAKAYANSPAREPMMAWMAAQTRYRGYAEGLLNNLRNYDAAWQPEDYAALGRSGLPVLAVWGTADTVNPFDQSRVLARHVPQMKIVPLEGKGHAITYGETDAVLAAVIPFFRAAGRPGS
ncbi:alpha/beta hydrolase [Bradyrhizobium prioriisuperbiae]|uniref:alpha/beta fold hydrolase n=1 Tax=Bradyrhizobium prioriisuperbiae TaxID=2854389 RepID=UPI0028E89FAD|nr:alpha/beta hydrolase [Bradyrhizobium prioritasuperba]